MTPAAAIADRLPACRQTVPSRRADTPQAINKAYPLGPSGFASHRLRALRCGRVAFGSASDPGDSSIPVCCFASAGADLFVAASGYKYRCGMICLDVEALLHSK